jgi:hypothetical protein
LLNQGPNKAAAAAAALPSDQQQQQQSPRTSSRGSLPSSQAIPLPRGPDMSLTYAGKKDVELLLSGLEPEFTVRVMRTCV